LSEVLRVIQFYNSGGYHCDAAGEDGYQPGAGAQDCPRHDSDYGEPLWTIDMSELLRWIQFYNSPGSAYHCDVLTEDGYAPGPAEET
nr:hypothetical protein [Candidatus Hydrogenedentota bacterium]